jgi:regulator of replication initiation timing
MNRDEAILSVISELRILINMKDDNIDDLTTQLDTVTNNFNALKEHNNKVAALNALLIRENTTLREAEGMK